MSFPSSCAHPNPQSVSLSPFEHESPLGNIQVFHAGRNIRVTVRRVQRETFSPCYLILMQSTFTKGKGSLLATPAIVEKASVQSLCILVACCPISTLFRCDSPSLSSLHTKAPYDTRGYIERTFYTSYPDAVNPPVIFAFGDNSRPNTCELVVRVGHCTGYSRHR